MNGPEFAKGHGTENDFVVLPDPEGALSLTDERVRALCDRQRGFGADGVLRVVRAGAIEGGEREGVPSDAWFMDYRNADGSLAEMCGNGVRVFVRYLVEAGWAGRGDITIGTRSGPKSVEIHSDGRFTVDMGPAKVTGESTTTVSGKTFSGIAIDLGNPHLACVTDVEPDVLDLTTAPPHDRNLFPNGVNIEIVRPLDAEKARMRVYERGVGETRSCGTGTVAATVAALRAAGKETGRRVIEVPGGLLEVAVTASTTTLTGPAVLVGSGHLDREWWESGTSGNR